MKEPLDERDITKKMLKRINEGAIDKYNDEQELTSDELSEEQENFREAVTPRVNFTGFKVYPKNKNVVFSGVFETLGGLEWQFTLEDNNGLYFTANNMPMSDDTLDLLKKLKGYYDNWADDWAKKIATEYNRNSDDDSEVIRNAEKV